MLWSHKALIVTISHQPFRAEKKKKMKQKKRTCKKNELAKVEFIINPQQVTCTSISSSSKSWCFEMRATNTWKAGFLCLFQTFPFDELRLRFRIRIRISEMNLWTNRAMEFNTSSIRVRVRFRSASAVKWSKSGRSSNKGVDVRFSLLHVWATLGRRCCLYAIATLCSLSSLPLC